MYEKCGDEEQYLVVLPALAVEVYEAGAVAADTVEISEVRVAEIYVAAEEEFSRLTNTSRAPRQFVVLLHLGAILELANSVRPGRAAGRRRGSTPWKTVQYWLIFELDIIVVSPASSMRRVEQ